MQVQTPYQYSPNFTANTVRVNLSKIKHHFGEDFAKGLETLAEQLRKADGDCFVNFEKKKGETLCVSGKKRPGGLRKLMEFLAFKSPTKPEKIPIENPDIEKIKEATLTMIEKLTGKRLELN